MATAAKAPQVEAPQVEARAEREFIFVRDSCRFCHCTEAAPCMIGIAEDRDGKVRLARYREEMTSARACVWVLPHVCSSPLCVQRLLEESDHVVMIDESRRRAG